MRGTGIIRRVDDLGRVVIPKELRRQINIKDGDPMELFIYGDSVIFRKYVPYEHYTSIIRNAIEAVVSSAENDTNTSPELRNAAVNHLQEALKIFDTMEVKENA